MLTTDAVNVISSISEHSLYKPTIQRKTKPRLQRSVKIQLNSKWSLYTSAISFDLLPLFQMGGLHLENN